MDDPRATTSAGQRGQHAIRRVKLHEWATAQLLHVVDELTAYVVGLALEQLVADGGGIVHHAPLTDAVLKTLIRRICLANTKQVRDARPITRPPVVRGQTGRTGRDRDVHRRRDGYHRRRPDHRSD